MSTIVVSEGTNTRLDRLKKKWKMRNKDLVIKRLIDDEDQLALLKEQTEGLIEVGEIAEKTLENAEKREERNFCENCITLWKCVAPECNVSRYEQPSCFSPKPSCVFKSIRKEDQKIDCAKDFSRMGKIHIVSAEFCSKCWDRKLAEFKGKEAEPRARVLEKPSPPIPPLTQAIPAVTQVPSTDIKTIECDYHGFSSYRITSTKELAYLPCVRNIGLACPNKECGKKVEKLMKVFR
jgi:hypothetical protein